ncbi:MAG: caspase family protein [Cyanobacteria bacterium J06627_8]
MNYTRRAFLRQAAIGLASIGVSQTAMAAAAHRYHQALAAPSPGRKLALLVGIDNYPNTVHSSDSPLGPLSLSGAVTDVHLQRELLVYRFGFKPDDVQMLVDGDATRQAIEETFLNHLVKQAEPGDLVVFHFSGLGSQVEVVNDDQTSSEIKNSLVPVDGTLPTKGQPFLNDIMADTLHLLVRSLNTEQVITFLDTGYSSPKEWQNGYFQLRSRSTVPSGQLQPDEQSLQSQLIKQTRLNKETISNRPYPGLLLNATDASHGVVECRWNEFSAGLFTYVLTQQLWWCDADTSLPMKVSVAGAKAEQLVGSPYQLRLSGTKTDKISIKTQRFQPIQSTTADGVVTSQNAESSLMQVFLGGVPPAVLNHYGVTSVFRCGSEANRKSDANSEKLKGTRTPATVPISSPTGDGLQSPPPEQMNQETNEAAASSDKKDLSNPTASPNDDAVQFTYVQLRSREGLYGQGRAVNGPSTDRLSVAGQLLFEHIRVLPKNISLNVALDSQLERIERVDATSALSNVGKISSVVAKEQSADVLFGKSLPSSISQDDVEEDVPDSSSSSESDRPPDSAGYGLFYLSRVSIPNTLDRSEEAVKTAVQRLESKLRSLLAAKLLRLTENQGSSLLGVQATLEMLVPQERILLQQTTFRSPWNPPESRLAQLLVNDGKVPSVPMGSKIRYRVQNYGDRPVYCVLVGVDSSDNIFIVHPSEALGSNKDDASVDDDSRIRPGEMLALPQSNTSAEWTVSGPEGLAETYVICSREPLTTMTQELVKAMRPMGNFRQMSMLSDATDPTDVMQAMLADLDKTSRNGETNTFGVTSDAYALHMERYASLSFIYRVV